jgi:hypothetical protein
MARVTQETLSGFPWYIRGLICRSRFLLCFGLHVLSSCLAYYHTVITRKKCYFRLNASIPPLSISHQDGCSTGKDNSYALHRIRNRLLEIMKQLVSSTGLIQSPLRKKHNRPCHFMIMAQKERKEKKASIPFSSVASCHTGVACDSTHNVCSQDRVIHHTHLTHTQDISVSCAVYPSTTSSHKRHRQKRVKP